MLDLTPAERRGAIVVLALFAIGTAWDLLHLAPATAPDLPAAPAGASPEPAAAPADAAPAARPLDLNTATAAQLDALPGIGPVLAARIVEQRRREGPFRSPDDLMSVHGIGPKLYARLRPLVTAGARAAGAAPARVQNARPPSR